MAVWDRKHPERMWVKMFIREALKKSASNELIFHEVFSGYKEYLAKMDEVTALHHKAFGKIFHELAAVDRKLAWREGKCQSVIVGYTFK